MTIKSLDLLEETIKKRIEEALKNGYRMGWKDASEDAFKDGYSIGWKDGYELAISEMPEDKEA